MDAEPPDLILTPLLLIGGQSSRLGSLDELMQFYDGGYSFQHALNVLHSAVPTATSIYVSLHTEVQVEDFKSKMASSSLPRVKPSVDDHGHVANPELQPILDGHDEDNSPAAGLLAAHELFPNATWLVLGSNFPISYPTALQQLVLEYVAPVTCFVDDEGLVEPLIAIWGPAALSSLKEAVINGNYRLDSVVQQVRGKLISPLRQAWITNTNTKEGWKRS